MESLAFDTHQFVKNLTAVGMPEKQAEVLANEQVRLIEANLATKRDIKELEAETKKEFANVRLAIKELEQHLTIRLGGMMVTGIAVVAALVKLL